MTCQRRQKHAQIHYLAPIPTSELESLNDLDWQGFQGVTWPNTLFKADLKGTHKDDGANCFQNRTSKDTFIAL